jgi:hypothetical protein
MKTKEFKTPFDYKRMSKKMLNEFNSIFSDYTDRRNLRISRKYSSDYNFYIDGDAFKILSAVGGQGKHDTCYNLYKTMFYENSSCFRSYAFDGWDTDCTLAHGKRVQNTFRKIFNDIMVESMYDSCVNYGMDFTYNRVYLVEDTLKYCLEGVMGISFHKYMSPIDYNNFKVCDEDGKYISFSYKGSEVKMKSGKAIRKILKVIERTCDDEQLKIMVNRLSSKFEGFQLRVVEGDDIIKYYNGDNYDDVYDLGSLGSSCMRNEECGDDGYFEIYKDNCKMLILINDDKDTILGRAILWRAEDRSTGDFVNVMDRIYSSEKVYQQFFDWALANDYYRKRYQSYDNSTGFISPRGMEEEMDFEIKISLDDYSYLPYMDTFAWGDSRVIRNDECFGKYTARDTSGGLEGRDDDNYDNYDDDDDYNEKW